MRDFFMLPFRPTNQPAWYGPVGYLAALLGVVLATGVLWVAVPFLSLGSIYLVYLVVVVAIAVGWGLKQGVVASVLSFLAANFFFIPPVFTFTIANAQDVLALVIFLGLATLTSQLVALTPGGSGSQAQPADHGYPLRIEPDDQQAAQPTASAQ